MSGISLVICVYRERDLLARLLRETSGLFDDLVVVHDGPARSAASNITDPMPKNEKPPAIDYADLSPDSPLPNGYSTSSGPLIHGSIHELVIKAGGQYFEGPRCFQQEPHWPFAWSRARNNWILRLDADELPGAALRKWIEGFRASEKPDESISGYCCIWPFWNGKRAVTCRWPANRIFLFHRRRVRFFGMAEQTPVADFRYESIPLVLSHEPTRRSYGLRNVLFRQQAATWRRVIAHSLLGDPGDLPCWRWEKREWPRFWNDLRRSPLLAGFSSLTRGYASTLRHQWRAERKIMPVVNLAGPLHHLLIAIKLSRLSAQTKKNSRV